MFSRYQLSRNKNLKLIIWLLIWLSGCSSVKQEVSESNKRWESHDLQSRRWHKENCTKQSKTKVKHLLIIVTVAITLRLQISCYFLTRFAKSYGTIEWVVITTQSPSIITLKLEEWNSWVLARERNCLFGWEHCADAEAMWKIFINLLLLIIVCLFSLQECPFLENAGCN